MTAGAAHGFLRGILACPACKGSLAVSPALILCVVCGTEFPQPRDDCLDLFPTHMTYVEAAGWHARQQATEAAYRELIANPAHAIEAYRNDLSPYAAVLSTYGGRVLDIGGGNGLVRHYLSPDARYVVVDPSLDWLDEDWTAVASAFPCLAEKPAFVRGVGEFLPFGDGVFEAALSIWSLNHAFRPGRLICETWRVLESGGRFLIILDDVPPRWRDLADGSYPTRDLRGVTRTIGRKLLGLIGRAPLQADHIRIRESDLRAWISSRFVVIHRFWVGAYLTLEPRKIARAVERCRTSSRVRAFVARRRPAGGGHRQGR